MKTKLVPIGNSRGVRLPKPMIRDAGLGDEVDIQVRNGTILITSVRNPRVGWAEAAGRMHDLQEDRLLQAPTATQFDKDECRW